MNVEAHDVVVVGGGLSGLGTAYNLRHRDVVLLEADQRLGGRIESIEQGEYWLNLGAHLVGGDDSLTARLARDLGLKLAHPKGSVTAVSLNGRVVAGGRPELMPFRLALPLAGRISLIRSGLRMRQALASARQADPAALLGAPEDPANLDQLPVDRRLDSVSFRDVLGPMHPDVAALMTTAAQRAGGELDDISGHYGVISSLGAWDVRRPNIVGGTEKLVAGLNRALDGRIRTKSEVLSVRTSVDSVALDVKGLSGIQHVRARACVVAVPASVAVTLIPDLPHDKLQALHSIRYSPYVVAGIFTTERGPMTWDGIYAMATPKRAFCMFFNPANALRDESPRRRGGCLVVYSASEPARRHLQLSDRAIRDLFLAELADIFPETRQIVSDVVIKRQPFGAPTPSPGRAALQPLLVQSSGRVVFAGDYLQYAGLDSALRTALRAAREVEALLGSAAPATAA